eukprot:7376785-Prymnesium_polylepis.2
MFLPGMVDATFRRYPPAGGELTSEADRPVIRWATVTGIAILGYALPSEADPVIRWARVCHTGIGVAMLGEALPY